MEQRTASRDVYNLTPTRRSPLPFPLLPPHSRPSAEAKGSHSGEISPRQPPSLSFVSAYNLSYSYFVPLLRSSISECLNSRVPFSKCQRTNERERDAVLLAVSSFFCAYNIYVRTYIYTHTYIYISYDVWVRYAFDARWKLRDEGFEISWSRSRTRTLFSNKEAR